MFQGMEYVYEVYRERSFSRAARNLFVSQPALSAAVKRVESRIGYPIFNRSTSPITLTECGERYIQAVEQMMIIKNDFATFVSDLGGLKTGHLTLGGSSLFSSCVLPKLAGEFRRRFPQVTISLIEESTTHLEEMLLSGVLDLMIDNYPFDETVFGRQFLKQEHLVLAVPRPFAVNRQLERYQITVEQIRSGEYMEDAVEVVPLQALQQEPFIMLKPENDTRRRGDEICRSAGFAPRVVMELDQQMTSYNITCTGMGISFVSDTLIRHVMPHPEVIYYKLPLEQARRSLYFFWKNDKYLSRAAEEFLVIASEMQV